MNALVIPVYQPSEDLIRQLETIGAGKYAAIVVADDGSGPAFGEILTRAAALPDVVVARHAHPVGRGAIIRTGIHAALTAAPELTAVEISGGQAYPAALLPHLLRVEVNGAEFELDAQLIALEHKFALPAVSRSPLALIRSAIRIRSSRAAGLIFASLAALILFAVAIAEVHGFASSHLFSEPIWLPWGERRLGHFVALFAAFSAPILILIPWSYAPVFAALIAAATIVATGPLAPAALVFFAISACALGSKVARKAEPLLATLLGTALYAFLMTLTARLPVNYPAVWAVVLAIPIALDAGGAVGRLREFTSRIRAIELPRWPHRAAFALLACILSIHWFAAIEPETSSDGLAMHLAVPMNIAAHHALTFQPGLFLWSVMPMGADFTYAILYQLGGESAVSLFNFTLLLGIVALIYAACRRFLPRGLALFVTALFASTPLVYLVTGSLFIENFICVMILGMLAALWRFRETGGRALLYAAAILAGAAAAAKLGSCVFVLLALPFAIAEVRRRATPRAALALALLLAVAAPPYVIAYAKTGNPIFPFANAIFPSPLLEHGVELRDIRFNQPIAWSTPYDLIFHSSGYFESQNGAFGFQYLLLIPLALMALLAVRDYAARTSAVIGLAAGAIVMATQPNARYVYAALPLITIAFGALLGRFSCGPRWMARTLVAAVILFTGFNIYFEAASGWYHRHFYSAALFRPNGRAQYLRETAPMRDVTQRFRRAQPTAPVLLVSDNDLADAGDHAYEFEWHQYSLWKRIATAESVSALRDIFNSLDVRHFIGHQPSPDEDPVSPASLGEFLAACTTPEVQNGRFYAAQITHECETLPAADLESRLANTPPVLVGPGTYDDFEPALRFHGPWTRTHGFTGPYRHTISYTDEPNAQAAIEFEGTSLTYVYTRAFNRGTAELTIDGESHIIDLYSPDIEWQSRTGFPNLPQGRHLVKLRPTGQKQAAAKGVFIDLDAFIVK